MVMNNSRLLRNLWLTSCRATVFSHRTAFLRSKTLLTIGALALMAILVSSPGVGRAQELSATLSGVVTDTSGAAIPNATITIALNGVNGPARVTQSDSSGAYLSLIHI